MRILFLDDSTARLAQLKVLLAPHHELVHVWLARDFQMRSREKFDVVFLDHDLDDLVDQDRVPGMYGDRPYDGGDAANDLCDAVHAGDIKPRHVVVHSWNEDGARGMVARLNDAEISVRRLVFGTAAFREFVRGL